jgi:hypothetical protein
MRSFVVLPALSVLLAALPAHAQANDAEAAARRAVLERQQQSDAFSLQLQQSQRRFQSPLGTPSAPSDAADLEQRLEQDRLHAWQRLRLALPGAAESAFELERRALMFRATGIPTWGPTLAPAERWTPTAERPRRSWAPTIEER